MRAGLSKGLGRYMPNLLMVKICEGLGYRKTCESVQLGSIWCYKGAGNAMTIFFEKIEGTGVLEVTPPA